MIKIEFSKEDKQSLNYECRKIPDNKLLNKVSAVTSCSILI